MMFGLRGSCAIEGVEKTAVAIKSAAALDENARLVVIFNSPLKDNQIDRTKFQTARRTWAYGFTLAYELAFKGWHYRALESDLFSPSLKGCQLVYAAGMWLGRAI
jgi:hypothetical protein